MRQNENNFLSLRNPPNKVVEPIPSIAKASNIDPTLNMGSMEKWGRKDISEAVVNYYFNLLRMKLKGKGRK